MRRAHDVTTVRAGEAELMAVVPKGALMERAAYGLAVSCAGLLGETGGVYGADVVVLAGSGNNGGDALFAAAQLARRGAKVLAVPVAASLHAGGAAALVAAGGRVALDDDESVLTAAVSSADLVIDGIVGIGGRGALRELAAVLAEAATQSPALVVAVDLPSGIDADRGTVEGTAVWADVTVTFGTLKPGLLVAPGALHAGVVELVDIGLEHHLPPARVQVMQPSDVWSVLAAPGPYDNKYSRGVAGLCAGSDRYPGAAVLAAAGAVHVGAGLVRYSGPAAAEVVRALPGCLVSTAPAGEVGRVSAWGVGPGIGLDDAARRRLDDVLALDAPVVVDADALTLLAQRPQADVLRLLSRRSRPTVLTPHAGEARRFGGQVNPETDSLSAARELAQLTGATVLLKGYTTVVAKADGSALVNPTGTPWLATGGTGDVLTGMLTALLATGADPLLAGGAAAFLHGLAARRAADGAATTALDIAAAVPAAVRSLAGDEVRDFRV